MIILLGTVLLTTLSGCEFDNLKDQQYGPVGPGNSGTDTTGTGTDTTTTDTTTAQLQITIDPASITIKTGETAQFTATVSGTTNRSVTWVVTSGVGSINASGLYQAPATISSPAEIVTIKAFSNANATISAAATVIVTPLITGTPGDTAKGGEICFQRDVLPIFQSNCAKSGCHDVTTRQKGYAFVDYDGIMRGIDPGRLGNSEIYEKITETRADKQMPPPPNTPLSGAQIATIRQWILEGARNTICPPPTDECDTTTVTYSGTIRPILDKYCIGCHSGANPPKGINLTNYDHVRTTAQDGRLRGVTARLAGYTPMPYGGDKLPDCEIRKIAAWITKGANND